MGSHAEPGRIEEATYLGMVTRYLVELTAGGRLTAVAQNLETAAAEALAARGRAVTVAWRDDLGDLRELQGPFPAGRRRVLGPGVTG